MALAEQPAGEYRRIEVTPLAGAMGAVIGGIDLRTINDDDVEEIHRAFLENLVVFFRGQSLTPQEQLAVARRWGEIHLHPFVPGLEDCPEVMEILKSEKDDRNFGGVWHSDQMFSPKPAMGTMLYAVETPAAGGDTMWANLYLAYESLSDGMKDLLGQMKGHSVGDNFGSHQGKSRREIYGHTSMKVREPGKDEVTEADHPMIRTHPETGRKALYIGNHMQYFTGMTREESAPLRAYLMEHATKPEFTCRFRWEPGSLAFWDNRCTQHYALNDYPGQRRRMHRITICGYTPF